MSWAPWDSFSQLFFWHIVQVSMVALVVWPIASFTSRRNAHISHLLWVLVLIKCLTPPVLALPTSPFCWLDQGNSYQTIVDSSVTPTIRPTKAEGNRLQYPETTFRRDRELQKQLSSTTITQQRQKSRSQQRQATAATKHPTQPVTDSIENAGPPERFSDTTTAITTLMIRGLTTCCLIGMFLTAITGVFNWIRLRRVIAHGISPEQLRQQVESLRTRLGVRRTVCLKVLPQQLGPAVTGIFRPTVLLPQSIVDALNHAELEAVIAHELIHFRRGDIVWAALQCASRCVFWFHPLVRMAIRQVTLESERCCDEQTVAALQCTPQQYALSLLQVVEHQSNFRPFALLPGVRPIDITKNRLERIMNFKDEMKQQTPFTAWAILLLGALVTLPGAAWVSAQSPPDQQRNQNLVALPEQTAIPAKEQPVYVKAYDVTELKRKSQEARAAEKKSKIDLPVDTATTLLMKSPPSSKQSVSCLFSDYVTTDESHPNRKTEFQLGGGQPTAQLIGDHLFLLATEEYHQFTKNYVADRSAHGFAQMHIQTEFIRLPRELLAAQNLDWKFLQDPQESKATTPISIPFQASFPETSSQTTAGLQASTSANPTVYLAVIDDRQLEQLRNIMTSENGVLGRTGPKTKSFFGQTACVSQTFAWPFVVGLRPATEADNKSDVQPIIKQFEVGTSLDICGVAAEDDAIEITCTLNHSAVTSVEVEKVLVKATHESPFQLENPKVETVQIHLTKTVPEGHSLLVASAMADSDDQMRMMILHCEQIHPKQEQGAPTKSAVNSNKTKRSHFPSSSKEHPFDPPKVPAPTKLIMTAGKNAKADHGDPTADNWPIIALMKNVGFDPEISGRFELTVESGVVTISGKDITLKIGAEEISAEAGELTFNENELSELIFRGNATIKRESDETISSADKIELKREQADSSEFFLKIFDWCHFEGNFHCGDSGEQTFVSDRATFDSRQTLLEGNATMSFDANMRSVDEKLRTIYKGNSIRFTYEDTIEINGKGEVVLEKDNLLQTIAGESISLNCYGVGGVVDGKSFEINPAFHELE